MSEDKKAWAKRVEDANYIKALVHGEEPLPVESEALSYILKRAQEVNGEGLKLAAAIKEMESILSQERKSFLGMQGLLNGYVNDLQTLLKAEAANTKGK